MTANSEDNLVELLAGHLDRYAEGDRTTAAASGPAGFPVELLTAELRRDSTWSGPPAGLKEAILSRVVPAVDGPAVGRPTVSRPTVSEHVVSVAPPGAKKRSAWRGRWSRLAWAVPAVAVAAAVFTVAVLLVDRALQPDPPHAEIYTVAGTALAPGATAEVAITPQAAGFVVALTIEGLPAAAPGSYFAAWLSGPRGDVPIGSFHQRVAGEQIRLWSGVDPDEYPRLVVTLQSEGDPPTPSGPVVLTGALTR